MKANAIMVLLGRCHVGLLTCLLLKSIAATPKRGIEDASDSCRVVVVVVFHFGYCKTMLCYVNVAVKSVEAELLQRVWHVFISMAVSCARHKAVPLKCIALRNKIDSSLKSTSLQLMHWPSNGTN